LKKKQEILADAKVSARQQCVYNESPYSEEIYRKTQGTSQNSINGSDNYGLNTQ